MAQQGLRQLALPLSQCSCSLSAFHQIIIQGSLSCAAKAVKFVQNGLGCEWLPSLPKSTASTRRCLALLLDPNSGLLLPAPLAHQLGQLDHQVAHQVAWPICHFRVTAKGMQADETFFMVGGAGLAKIGQK